MDVSQLLNYHFVRVVIIYYPEIDLEWTLIEIAEGKTLHTFYGNWSRPDTIQSVKFCKYGKEVLAKNKKERIIERIVLCKL
jgi:hypothetical protein